MSIKRILIFSVMLYIATAVIGGIIQLVLGDPSSYIFSLRSYIVLWIVYIPLILLLGKWYFRHNQPSLRDGFFLGCISILTLIIFDGLIFLILMATNGPTEVFSQAYRDWKLYVTFLWIISLCVFAGWEFDATYTTPTTHVDAGNKNQPAGKK